mgnify:CR=1 FL=1
MIAVKAKFVRRLANLILYPFVRLRALYPCSRATNQLKKRILVSKTASGMMRAEVEQQVADIKQSLELLRRRL